MKNENEERARIADCVNCLNRFWIIYNNRMITIYKINDVSEEKKVRFPYTKKLNVFGNFWMLCSEVPQKRYKNLLLRVPFGRGLWVGKLG